MPNKSTLRGEHLQARRSPTTGPASSIFREQKKPLSKHHCQLPRYVENRFAWCSPRGVYPEKNTHPHRICDAKHAEAAGFVMQKMDGDGCFFLDRVRFLFFVSTAPALLFFSIVDAGGPRGFLLSPIILSVASSACTKVARGPTSTDIVPAAVLSALFSTVSSSRGSYQSLRLEILKVKIICNAKQRLQSKHHF